MKTTPKSLWKRIEEKLWLWKPLLLFLFIGVFIFGMVYTNTRTEDLMNKLHSREPISKVEMTVKSDSGENNVVLTDRDQLDSIDNAFKAARMKVIQRAKVYDTRAEVTIYKGQKKINVSIETSKYTGWLIVAGDEVLISEYLFALVERYARK